jgi:hypothetical protein
VVDGIDHFTRKLADLNEKVRILQIATFKKRQKIDDCETVRQQNVHVSLLFLLVGVGVGVGLDFNYMVYNVISYKWPYLLNCNFF